MTKIKIYQVDAFTTTPFQGNQAGVVLNAGGLTEAQMQAIAQEMNLQATVFVKPPRDPKAHFQLRFFTPAVEENLCGHGTIAAFHVLAQAGKILFESSVVTQYQETKAGLLPVLLYVHQGEIHRIVMAQNPPVFRDPELSIEELAPILGIDASQINRDLPIEIVSTGLPQLFVPVKSISSLEQLQPDFQKLAKLNQQLEVFSTHVFTLESRIAGAVSAARHFGPAAGVPEDPATGTAAGGLGCYLVKHGVCVSGDFLMEQGYEMKRPSTLFVEVKGTKEQIKSVRVGGRAVIVMAGEMQVP